MGGPALVALGHAPAPVDRATCCDGVRERFPTFAELFRRRVSTRSYMMPVGTSSAQASAGATRTTPPAYIISCL